jgi:hypothetical protein
MAKPDSNFVYYTCKTKEGRRNKLWKCIRVKYAPCYVRKGPQLTQKHTRPKRRMQHCEWIQCLLRQLIGKQRHNEIGMLPSVWNVTEVFCFPFRSWNVNVCRVSDSWACNIYLPMWEAWITVLSCRSQNVFQKGRNRLRSLKKVYKHMGCRNRHTHDSRLAALCCHPVSETSRWNDGKGWEGESMCCP